MANYAALLTAEDELDLMSLQRMKEEDRDFVAAVNRAARASPPHGWHAAIAWHLFFKRDREGRTLGQRWEAAGFPGLKNDARVFFRGKMKTRVALLEVRRVFDHARFEAVDLLQPSAPPMLIVDRSLGGRVTRFFTALTWIYPEPHFWRLSGTAITTSDLGPFSALEMIEACLAHLGGPASEPARGEWLAANFPRVDAALTATGLERQRQLFASMDVTTGWAKYALRGSVAAVKNALRSENVEDDALQPEERDSGFTEALIWLDEAPEAASPLAPAGRTILGRVVLGNKECRVEATGAAKLERLRASFEARLGELVEFSRERRDNIGARMAAEGPAADLSLVPPRLLENPTEYQLASARLPEPPAGMSLEAYQATFERDYRQRWIDERLPALEGRSPREAAGDPVFRTRVVELVKGLVRQVDHMNLNTGASEDINGLIRELGLTEIDFPPPPLRPIPADEAKDDEFADDEDFGDDDEFEDADQSEATWGGKRGETARPPIPPLIEPPLSFDTAIERLQQSLDQFDLAADALEELTASGSDLIDEMSALTADLMNDDEFSFFVTFLLQGWFALVPLGVRAPAVDFQRMTDNFDREFERMTSGSGSAAGITSMLEACRQPGLLQAMTAAIFDGAKRAPEKMRPSPKAAVVMALALKALIDELDAALRRA